MQTIKQNPKVFLLQKTSLENFIQNMFISHGILAVKTTYKRIKIRNIKKKYLYKFNIFLYILENNPKFQFKGNKLTTIKKEDKEKTCRV